MHKNIHAKNKPKVLLSWLPSSKVERFKPEYCHLCRWQSIKEVNTKQDQNVVYSVMLECKIAQEV